MTNMEIKWESNSRAKHLAAVGKIKDEDIILRTTTDNFPTETATVRMQKLAEKVPHVVVHIRGKTAQKKLWNGRTYECASTCRITLAGIWGGQHFGMSSNGELDEDLNWLDVHNVVEKVKVAMELN
jgi:hypothetical protein